jgi:PAS domain S-box-containing protein
LEHNPNMADTAVAELPSDSTRLRALFETMQDAVLFSDDQARFVDANPAACTLLGYSREELLQLDAWSVTPPAARGAVTAAWQAFLRAGRAAGEYTVLRKDGSTRDVECRGVARFQPGLHLSVLRDITERKHAEQALRRQAQVLDQIHDAVIATDLDGYIISWNKGAERLYGYTADEIRGKHVTLLYREEDRQTLAPEVIQSLKEMGNVEVEKPVLTKAGDVRWVHLSLSLLHEPDGSPTGMIGYSLDITERRCIEAALRDSEERFREMAENIEEVFWLTSADENRLDYISPAYERVYGRSRESLYRDPHSWLDAVHPEDAPRIRACLREPRAARPDGREYRVVRPDGSIRWVHVRLFPVRAENGEVHRLAGIALDVTERLRAKEVLRRQVQRLEAVREIDRAILAARSAEEIACAAVSRMRRLVPCDRASVVTFDFTAREAIYLAADVPSTSRFRTQTRVPFDALGDLSDLWRGESRRVSDYEQDPRHPLLARHLVAEGLRSYLVVPLLVQDDLIGCLGLSATTPGVFTDEHAEVARDVADAVAVALQEARLVEQVQVGQERLQALSRRLVDAQEAERRHVARELHDEIGQALTALKLFLEMNARAAEGTLADGLREIQGMVDELIGRVREMSLALRPPMLDDLGLVPTLQWHFERYTARTGVRVHFQHTDNGRLPADVETAVYRIVQEALTNVARHAGVDEVTVRLWTGASSAGVQVEDRGKGFFPETQPVAGNSGGLTGMRERSHLLGGRLTVEARPGGGTRLTATLPVAALRNGQERS